MSLVDHPAGSMRPSALRSGEAVASGEIASDTSHSAARTRISGAWAAVTVGLAAVVVVLVFALQNLKTVEVTFISMHWHLPLAILLLLVAVLGGLVVFAFGAARIVQLRMAARHSGRA